MIRFTDSTSYASVTNAAVKYALSGNGTIGLGAGRFGGYSVQLGNTGFGARQFTKVLGAQATWYAHFSFRPSIGIGGPMMIGSGVFQWQAGGPSRTVLTLEATGVGTFKVWSGGDGSNGNKGNLIIAPTYTYDAASWHSVEIVATFGSSGTSLGLYVDDVLIGSAGPLTWAYSDLPDRFVLKYEALTSTGWSFCDVVVNDSTGASNNARLGPCRVPVFFPIADAQAPQWFRNTGSSDASCVNEQNGNPAGAPDFDVTYTQSSGGALDLFQITAPPCVGLILGLALNVCAEGMTGSAAVNAMCQPQTTSPTVDQIGSTLSFLSHPAYTVGLAISEVSLNTGQAWNAAEVGAAFWGFAWSSGQPRVTQFYVEEVVSLRSVSYECGGSGSYSF